IIKSKLLKMTKELNEDTTFKMSVKTMGMIAAGIAVVVGGWYSLMQEIQEAKEQPVQIDVNILKDEILEAIPAAEITRMEFDMKDQMIRQTILTTQEDVEEMKKTLEKIEDKLYNR
ncbi:hypothetical protein OAT73_07510, partial [Candidatus Poseidoniaceae archaeon]|nr:hypothetical protein [Candidatus Poseidoniaceae archaeon]